MEYFRKRYICERQFLKKIKLNNADIIEIPHGKGTVQTVRDTQPDKVKKYGHLVLESSTTYFFFLELAQRTNRQKCLPF